MALFLLALPVLSAASELMGARHTCVPTMCSCQHSTVFPEGQSGDSQVFHSPFVCTVTLGWKG